MLIRHTPARFSPPTNKQLIEIHALEHDISALGYEMNRLYSALLSMALPAVIGVIFTIPQSPLHNIYQHLKDKLEPHAFTITKKLLLKFHREDNALLNTTYNSHINNLMTQYSKPPCCRDINHLIEIIDDTIADHDKNPAFAQEINELKNQLGDFIRSIVVFMQKYKYDINAKIEKQIPKADNASKYTMKQLIELLSNMIAIHAKIPKSHFNRLSNEFAEKYIPVAISIFTWPLKASASVLLQFYGIDKILHRYRPYGIMQAAPPVFDNRFSEHETQQFITKLQEHKSYLTIQVNVRIKVSRTLFLMLAPFIYLLLQDNENSSPIPMLLTISISTMALKNILQDIKAWHNERQLSNTLNTTHHTMNKAWMQLILQDNRLKAVKHHIEITRGDSLESSSATIYFSNQLQHLSTKKIATCFKDSLLYLKMNYIHSDRYIVTFSLEGTSTKSLRALYQHFYQSLQHELNLIKLQTLLHQLVILLTDKSNWAVERFFDKQGFPNVTIEFDLPLSYDRDLQKLQDILQENTIHTALQLETIHLSISGNQPLNEKALQQWINQLSTKQSSPASIIDLPQVEQKPTTTYSLSAYRLFQRTSTAKAAPEPEAKAEKKAITIQWPRNKQYEACHYSSEAPTAVQPLRAHHHTPLRWFVKNELDLKKTPDLLYKHVEAQVAAPRFARKKKGMKVLHLMYIVKETNRTNPSSHQ